jgi:replicative DNA helicase
MSNYIRVCSGLMDKGKLVPIDTNVYKGLDLNQDHYTSAFIYNEEQFAKFKANGSVAGIDDTFTDKLYWDFDSEGDLNQARLDAAILCARLEADYKIPSNSIALYFSGKKGFQVEVLFSKELFTPSEAKSVCLNIGEGLPTLDRQIYNASRILRLPLSRHQGSGLFKIPLNYQGLSEVSIEDIKEEAKGSFPLDDLKGLFSSTDIESKAIREFKTKAPKIEERKLTVFAVDISSVDWAAKPKFLTPEKYLLSLGFFGSGERSHALMILGSTFKSQGFNETQCYHLLKSAAEIQSDRTGDTKFSKSEIYKNIISQIYALHWKGGTYAVTNDELLQELSLLVPLHVKNANVQDAAISIQEGFLGFREYAKNIDKNTIKTGIKALDNKIRLQTGRLYSILGAPGAGKTSMTTIFLNNTSISGDHNIFFSFDMSGPDTIQKLIQKHTGLTAEKIYQLLEEDPEGNTKKFHDILAENYKNTTFVFKTGQSLSDIKQTIIDREKQLGVSFRLVIVDYLELVQSKFSDPTQASMESIQGLREIAVGMNKAVIALLQPSKAGGSIDEPITSYHAAKGSSSIAQACTAMLTIHRPGCTSRTPEWDKFLGIDCVKNRAGPLFSLDLHWHGATGNLRELDSVERIELKELMERKKNDSEADADSSYLKF